MIFFSLQSWDFIGGYEVTTQLKTAYTAYILATGLAGFLAGFAYM